VSPARVASTRPSEAPSAVAPSRPGGSSGSSGQASNRDRPTSSSRLPRRGAQVGVVRLQDGEARGVRRERQKRRRRRHEKPPRSRGRGQRRDLVHLASCRMRRVRRRRYSLGAGSCRQRITLAPTQP
jgi:hypothetical protein